MKLVKPYYNRNIFWCLDDVTYTRYSDVYSNLKLWRVQSIYEFLASIRLFGIVKEMAKGTIVKSNKRRLVSVILVNASYGCLLTVKVIINSTGIVKSCKIVYTSVHYLTEAFEDPLQVPFLLLDLILFRQAIVANKEKCFNS